MIGGNKFFSYAVWILKKKAQVLGRTHLSHAFAILLGILTIYREREIFRSLVSLDWSAHLLGLSIAAIVGLLMIIIPLRVGGWELVILLLTCAFLLVGLGLFVYGRSEFLVITVTVITILAGVWEIFGNKLTTSPQELRFVTAIQSLLSSLQKLTYGEDREPDLGKRLDDFLEGFLEVTRKTLCGDTKVDAGFMREVPSQEKLELHRSSKEAVYPPELTIPLPRDKQDRETETGPAGVSYALLRTVYMPFKSLKRAFPFQLVGEQYEPSEPSEGWIEAPEPSYERFCSVLCTPVAVYRKENAKRPFGVLNYSTKSRDPFVDRDFAMSECFSSILAQAMEAVRREALTPPPDGQPSV